MSSLRRWLLALALAAPLALHAAAFEESVLRVPVKSFVFSPTIDVTVLRPPGAGPFPLAVISHGSPRTPEERKTWKRQRFIAQAQVFLGLGFAVVVPTRRGYADSDGPWAEGYGSCDRPDYYHAGLETARDVRAAVDAVSKESWADATRILLVGHSAGGFGSLAASSESFAGLVGVVNFAGGRGSSGPDVVCNEARLVDSFAEYGSHSRVPALFIYSENDHFFGPALARRMYDAFVRAGGHAQFVRAPASGADGHSYFLQAVGDWKPTVTSFVNDLGVVH
jgi:dipeptidyl aminopeptidase/acylaminoacyl peptidase